MKSRKNGVDYEMRLGVLEIRCPKSLQTSPVVEILTSSVHAKDILWLVTTPSAFSAFDTETRTRLHAHQREEWIRAIHGAAHNDPQAHAS
jgi:hypothetical protein